MVSARRDIALLTIPPLAYVALVPALALTRRKLFAALGAASLSAACRRGHTVTSARRPNDPRIAAIEARIHGRLGVFAATRGGRIVLSHRHDERFAMCSTFKLPLAAAVLARVDAGHESLERRIPFGEADLLEYAPLSRAHLAEGSMTVETMSAGIITVSDNTAANLLLATLGGPVGLTRFFRDVGDGTSRLDRTEPTLNTAIPGDARDTTTPEAMATTVRRIVFESALTAPSRARMIQWLEGCTTGATRLRAGLPASWRAGDKTGTGENGATCDVAVAWPPSGEPIVIAAYLAECGGTQEARNAALADVARVVAGTV